LLTHGGHYWCSVGNLDPGGGKKSVHQLPGVIVFPLYSNDGREIEVQLAEVATPTRKVFLIL
jgi:hypothetical protein